MVLRTCFAIPQHPYVPIRCAIRKHINALNGKTYFQNQYCLTIVLDMTNSSMACQNTRFFRVFECLITMWVKILAFFLICSSRDLTEGRSTSEGALTSPRLAATVLGRHPPWHPHVAQWEQSSGVTIQTTHQQREFPPLLEKSPTISPISCETLPLGSSNACQPEPCDEFY